ncbi:MAG: metal ABC transporter substrate-binding protein, partial [Eubacteriales bacterium]|nr:metal ABC transporter substrate-binding protein [Eubacteriales bacterium]
HEENQSHDHHMHEDEHIWLSLKNAQLISALIAENIIKLDPANEEIYKNNLNAYLEKLKALDKKYEETVKNAKINTLLFGDRFPFRYLVDDYGLEYFAAFEGCSAESEASFETIAFLANKLKELKLSGIIILDGSTGNIAKAVVGASSMEDVETLILDSMQTMDKDRINSGENYIGIMEQNLETLKKALN